MVMAMLLFAVGLMLETLRVKDTQEFEYKLKQISIFAKNKQC